MDMPMQDLDARLAEAPGEFVKLLDVAPGVKIFKLNRPDAMNSWHGPMRREMTETVEALALTDVRAVIVAGDARAFSAGEDVRGMGDLSTMSTKRFRAIARSFHALLDNLEALEAPVIAAIEGVAAGGGMELALSCDFRVLGRKARMGLPEVNVGLVPGSGGCSRLVRTLGLAKAKQVIMLEGMMSAERADQLGLVTELVEAGHALEAAVQMGLKLADKAPQALGMVKLVLNSCGDVDLASGRKFERLGQSVLKKTSDHAEGTQAFLQKRKPEWKDA